MSWIRADKRTKIGAHIHYCGWNCRCEKNAHKRTHSSNQYFNHVTFCHKQKTYEFLIFYYNSLFWHSFLEFMKLIMAIQVFKNMFLHLTQSKMMNSTKKSNFSNLLASRVRMNQIVAKAYRHYNIPFMPLICYLSNWMNMYEARSKARDIIRGAMKCIELLIVVLWTFKRFALMINRWQSAFDRLVHSHCRCECIRDLYIIFKGNEENQNESPPKNNVDASTVFASFYRRFQLVIFGLKISQIANSWFLQIVYDQL